MLTLDEYGRRLVVRLEGCAEVAQASMLLAEADLWLEVSRIREPGRAAFWQSVNRELALFADEMAVLRARHLASLLRGLLNDGASATDDRESVVPGRWHARAPV